MCVHLVISVDKCPLNSAYLPCAGKNSDILSVDIIKVAIYVHALVNWALVSTVYKGASTGSE